MCCARVHACASLYQNCQNTIHFSCLSIFLLTELRFIFTLSYLYLKLVDNRNGRFQERESQN